MYADAPREEDKAYGQPGVKTTGRAAALPQAQSPNLPNTDRIKRMELSAGAERFRSPLRRFQPGQPKPPYTALPQKTEKSRKALFFARLANRREM